MVEKEKVTLEIAPETTPQEIFDFVIAHLAKQGSQSANSEGVCSYRGLNNTMCAIGCLIPDEFYDPSMEGANVEELLINCENEESLFYISDFLRPYDLLLFSLQQFHDNSGNWDAVNGFSSEGLKELTYIALKERLVLPEFLLLQSQ